MDAQVQPSKLFLFSISLQCLNKKHFDFCVEEELSKSTKSHRRVEDLASKLLTTIQLKPAIRYDTGTKCSARQQYTQV
ncbi:expressed unknown protein [Seminavis robusta]|uniref:Uncharacterized protein n=1 Tax=Seminavis robusta TaxID=568900 RepID=A0A9N8HGT6_9STRA|nr:expressed unknown protein [Seminavis robusta]|eukprot:Sro595_g172690.1 n/a (78) ;mRNA; r:49162-49787